MQPICTHTISVQSSKPSHAYPIIRFPREFHELVGSRAEIYQTSCEDGIAFFVKVVDRSKKKLSKGSFETTPAPGHNYIVIDLTLTNMNKNDLYMGNAGYFKLSTSDGTAYSYSSWTYLLTSAIGAGVFHTNPGEKVAGQIAFEIPQSAKATALTYGDGFNPSVTTNL
jgi:hypothetical protein